MRKCKCGLCVYGKYRPSGLWQDYPEKVGWSFSDNQGMNDFRMGDFCPKCGEKLPKAARIVGWGNMTGEDKCDCGKIASLIVEVNGEAIPKCSSCVALDTEDKVGEVLMKAFGEPS
jgi:hypothetical protein